MLFVYLLLVVLQDQEAMPPRRPSQSKRWRSSSIASFNSLERKFLADTQAGGGIEGETGCSQEKKSPTQNKQRSPTKQRKKKAQQAEASSREEPRKKKVAADRTDHDSRESHS